MGGHITRQLPLVLAKWKKLNEMGDRCSICCSCCTAAASATVTIAAATAPAAAAALTGVPVTHTPTLCVPTFPSICLSSRSSSLVHAHSCLHLCLFLLFHAHSVACLFLLVSTTWLHSFGLHLCLFGFVCLYQIHN